MIQLPEIHTTALHGGNIEILTARCGLTPAMALSVLIGTGTATAVALGYPRRTAHDAASMLRQGCRGATAAGIADRIDYNGAFLSLSASSQWTQLDIMALNAFVPRLLPLFARIATTPLFPAPKLKAAQRENISNLLTNRSRTSWQAASHLRALIAGKEHPGAKIDTEDDILAITTALLQSYWQTAALTAPLRIVCTYGGKKSESEITDMLSAFALRMRTDGTAYTSLTPARPYAAEPAGTHFVEMPHALQTSAAIGIPAISRSHPDYIPLRIAVTALGGYFGSRLMTAVREEQGLTYGISASLNGSAEGSYVAIRADFDPSYTDRVLDAIHHEIHLLATKTMDADEFGRLIAYLRTTVDAVAENPRSFTDYITAHYTVGTPADYALQQQHILDTITPEHIRLMAATYLEPWSEARIVLAGPAGQK